MLTRPSRFPGAFPVAYLAVAIGLIAGNAAAQSNYAGIGRAATPAEIKAWDIDVRPDFKGLPPGSGSVAAGQVIWESKCASCHGTFGESNEVFTPIVGGTTKEDIRSGRVASLTGGEPHRTTLMKLSSLSALWDYINRAMPWTAPKSLSTNEVYAVVAYILNLGDIIGADFVLSDRNIRDVQNRLPNRNGKTRNHGMWDIKGKPDVRNAACMRDCVIEIKIASAFPDSAKGDHGNLALQNRLVGPARGGSGEGTADTIAMRLQPANARQVTNEMANEMAASTGCLACHGVNKKIVGPGFDEVAERYKNNGDVARTLVDKVRMGGSGVWGNVPMPPQPSLNENDAFFLIKWILSAPSPSK